MEPDAHLKQKMISTSIVSIALVGILVIFIIFFAKNQLTKNGYYQSSTQPTQAMQEQKTETVTGSMGLTIKGGKKSFVKGEKVGVFIYADSKETEIEGYDAVIGFDGSKLKFEEAKSLVEGIDSYDTEEAISNNHSELIVTGVKGLSVKNSFVFKNTALSEITFTALQSGNVDITLVYEPQSKRDSNLISSTSSDILNNVVGTKAIIK